MRFSSLFRPFHRGLFCYPFRASVERLWQGSFTSQNENAGLSAASAIGSDP